MKKVIFLGAVLFSVNVFGQAPAWTITTRDALVGVGANRSPQRHLFYDHAIDTTFDEVTLSNLQMFISGTIAVSEVIGKSQVQNGRRVPAKTLNVLDGTKGKVVAVVSNDSARTAIVLDGDTSWVFTHIKPRVILVSFTTKENEDIVVPFSAAPLWISKDSISGDEQFTTSHVVSNQTPLYTYKLGEQTYRVAGEGTLLFDDGKPKRHIGKGRKWNQ